MRIGIGGASGFVGSALVAHLRERGHSVLKFVRGRAAKSDDEISWNPAKDELNATSLDGLDAVVNLSGENLANRWSPERKKAFRTSRLQATGLISKTLAQMPRKPAVLVSASAVGYYGQNRGNEELDEHSTAGSDFLANLCKEWEAATMPALDAGVRVVNTRFGLTMNPKGGVLEKLLLPFKLGAGGKLGSGDQWFSWIALSDHVAAILHVIEQAEFHGPVNLTSPNPVTNEEFAKKLGNVLHRPAIAAVPAPFIRLALGREMADATVLASQKALPRRLILGGYEFAFPDLEDALRHELGMSGG